MADAALVYAGVGGVLWGFGPFGKRYGVAAATAENKVAISAVTYLAYAAGTFVFPAGQFLSIPSHKRSAIFSDDEWRSRLPGIVAAGICCGCGGPCATYALALAGRSASCLISMVTNGIYSVIAALLIVHFFNERPGFLQYLSAVLILAGVLMMEAGKTAAKKDEDSELADERASERSSRTWYGATREWYSRATTTGPSVLYAVLAGVLWGAGPLGKRYGAGGAEEGMRAVRSGCTFFVYTVATFVPVSAYFAYRWLAGELGAPDEAWLRRSPLVVLCGMLSGLGGVLATYAFALADPNESALLSMVENGVYTACGALLIGLVYQERLTAMQTGAGVLMCLGVVCASASGRP